MSEGSFAQSHLEKYGWEKGKGLGRSETGITDAIKPKLKFDTAGIGHDAGERFSFHWWDHVFNKAAKNIHVENNEDGVKVRQKGTKANLINNKRPTHDHKTKSLLYGSFVKHGTLNPDGAISQDKESSSSSSSSDESDDDKPPDTYEGNDELLFKACGGRTAHKGARHGLHLSGKLQRIEEQENHHSNMMKMQKETKGASTDDEVERVENGQMLKKKKKKKRKNRTKEKTKSEELMDTVESAQVTNRIHVQGEEIPTRENSNLARKPSKKKKKSKQMDKTRNLENTQDIRIDSIDEEGLSENSISPEIQLKKDDDSMDATRYRKKKSKKEKKNKKRMNSEMSREEQEIVARGEIQEESLPADEPMRKKKSKKEKGRLEMDGKVVHHGEEELDKCKEQKDSKRKSRREQIAIDECIDNDRGNEVEIVEELELKKKKKDKRTNEKRPASIKEEENDVTGVSCSQNGDVCQDDTMSRSGSKKKRKRKSDKGLY